MRFIPPIRIETPIPYGPRAGVKGALGSLLVSIPFSTGLAWFFDTSWWFLAIPVFAVVGFFVRGLLPGKGCNLPIGPVLW